MEIQAIYEDGRLTLPEHIQLKSKRLTLRVVIPDEELFLAAGGKTPAAEPGGLQEELNRLLGPAAMERPEASTESDRETFQSIMEERDQYRG